MASTLSLRSRMASAVRALAGPPAEQKDIWGRSFTDFMGMAGDTGSGVREIQDQPSDYNLARTAESYVYRCEEVRGTAISQVPLRVWQLDDEGNRKNAVEHEALGVLQTTNPYGYVDGVARLMRYTLMSLDMHGRNAWKLAFGRGRQPTEIYWQIPTSYTPLPDPDRFFGGIRIMDPNGNENGVRTIPPEELVYLTTDNPANPLLGTSKIQVLREAVNLRRFSTDANMAFFRNSMRPDWILSGNWSNTEENVTRLRRQIRRWLSGANNRQPLVLGEGAAAHLLTASHQDAEWIGQQRLSQEEISAVFGVPLIYLNNLERATYENIQTAKLILWHDTMIPECDILAEDMTRRFLWRFWPETQERKLVFGFHYDKIEGLGEDLARIWERMTKLMHEIDNQVVHRQLTPDQAREIYMQMVGEIGLDTDPWKGTVPGGADFFLPYMNVPADQLSVQAVIDIEAARGGSPQLVENIPGAEHAGDNALRPNPNNPAPAPAKPAADPAAAAQPPSPADPAQAKPPKPPKPKAPPQAPKEADPGTVRRLKRHYQDLQTQALRRVRSDDFDLSVPLYDYAAAAKVGEDLSLALRATIRAGIAKGEGSPDLCRRVMEIFRQAIDNAEADAIEVKEQFYTDKRPAGHDHSTDAGELPCIVLDLHGTITPSRGFTAPGAVSFMLPPFPGCKEALDLLVAGGCCLHLCTAALSPKHTPDILTARRRLVEAYITYYGLPISFVSGKVGAHIYYDDRMVTANGDWSTILPTVLDRLDKRFDRGEDGLWRRKDIPGTGDDYVPPDAGAIGPDKPRGLSTPVLDVDLHRCLFEASSSKLKDELKPGALEAVKQIYNMGFTINLSCAGWDPSTHTADESAARLASLRQQVREAGVPYDDMVSKDHPDVAIDDKGIWHSDDWEADLPILLAALGQPHPEDEITGSTPDEYDKEGDQKGVGPPGRVPFVKAPASGRPLLDQLDQATTYHGKAVLKVLRQSADPTVIAQGWADRAQPKAADDLNQQAEAYVRSLNLGPADLKVALGAIYADGWMIGIAEALKLADAKGMATDVSRGLYAQASAIDWSKWKPGNPAAADLLGGDGLQALLDEAGVTIRGINATTMQGLATVLANGAEAGDSVDTIARALREYLGDAKRAATVAQTELARAASRASLDTYLFNGIQGKGWIASSPCPLCARNVGSVIPVNAVFPSGHRMPPAHPHCRCCLSPFALLPQEATG